jgi:tRNA threonylcarbamoyladenosine biosynthesis protein TsaB
MHRPLILALDTSTPVLSCALLRRENALEIEVLQTRRAAPPAVVSTLVPGLFDEMLAASGAKLDDVGVVVAGLGPGLFTGVRVAVATMKAIAYARRLPLVGAGSLEAMALAAARGHELAAGDRVTLAEPHESGWICPVIDARKGEVYAGIQRWHEGRLESRLAPSALPPKALLPWLEGADSPMAVGAGAGVLDDGRQARAPLTPGAAEIALLALARSPSLAFDAAAVLTLEPHYLRPPEAEVARQKRLAAG